ncbi:MAG: helix-turn-helix domain-containing protein [Microcella sp.]
MRWFRARSRRDFGGAVADARKDAKLTQFDLAERTGLSRSTVQRLEGGEDVSLEAALTALAELGFEAIIVPRRSRVQVSEQ